MSHNEDSMFNQLDVYWIVLIVVGIVMFISSVITIVVLCLLWRRHRKISTQVDNKPNENTQIPMQIKNRQSQNYETQKIEIFVPPDEEDTAQRNLGEFHGRVTPQGDIQQMHQYNQRTNKAYF